MPFWPALLLLAAVILVNGWTDAPNAITTAVASGAVSFPAAVALAAVCNLFGVVTFAQMSDAVARTLFEIADFGPDALPALAAALTAVVVWAVTAWRWGIPTSESHALVAGLVGAALGVGAETLRLAPLLQVAVGLLLSLTLGWLAGCLFVQVLPRKTTQFYASGQILGAALTAFLHGAQDGQKFLGVLALILSLGSRSFALPRFAAPICALLMALGTLLGGRRIVDTVGKKMVSLDLRAGFAADLASALSLGVCTLAGMPVSTTHVKTAAILGAGTAPDGKVAGALGLAWLLTFPICGFFAFLLVKWFLLW